MSPPPPRKRVTKLLGTWEKLTPGKKEEPPRY